MLLSPLDAWLRLDRRLAPLPAEWLPRREARGRVLAAPLAALADLPPGDVSAMDGYVFAGPVAPGDELPVAGRIAAGDAPGRPLPHGSCLRIMTGAPVPPEADRVAPIEWTDGGRERVRFHREVPAGEAIRRGGEVCRTGTPLLPAGTPLGPGALSLLAAQGYERVPVHRPPRVAVLATGDEVVPPEAMPAPGQLRDSHTDFLLAALAALGVPAVSLGISRDDPEELAARVAAGLAHDVLLLCGGVSAGELDLVEGALARAGCETLFDGVAMQPGKPLVVAAHRHGLAFGLPGNPASAMVAWWLFVRPALRRLLGGADGFWRGALPAVAGAELPRGRDRDRFLPARLKRDASGLVATPLPSRGSHDLPSFAAADALLRVVAGADARAAGAVCEALPLPEAPPAWLTPEG